MSNTLDLKLVRDRIEASGFKIKHIAKEIGVQPCTLSSFLSGNRGLGNSARILLYGFLKIDRKSIEEKAG